MSTNWPTSKDSFGTAVNFATTVLAADPNNLRAAVDALEGWALGPVFVTARQYGAKGDGSTNDTVAIQDALNAVHAAGGGEVRLGPGVFMVSLSSHPINSTYGVALILYADTKLTGAGRDATIIRLIASQPAFSSASQVIFNYNIAAGGDEQITIEDLTVDGNAGSQSQPCTGISFLRVRGVRIARVRGLNCYSTYPTSGNEAFCFDFGDSTDGSWTDCEAIATVANTASGFSANSSSNVKWNGCLAFGMGGGQGFTHNTCENVQHVNCHSYKNGNIGFNSESSVDVVYTGCIAGGESTNAATYPYAANTTLGNTGNGFTLNGGTNVQLIGCASRYNGGDGIDFVTTTGASVIGGVCANNTTAQIVADSTSAPTLTIVQENRNTLVGHVASVGSTPTLGAAPSGISAQSISGTDTAALATYTTTASPPGAGVGFTINFATAYTTAPITLGAVVSGTNTALNGLIQPANVSTTAAQAFLNTAAPASSTMYLPMIAVQP